eukprot:6202541-Heterocapsa_arctica.AAC.1
MEQAPVPTAGHPTGTGNALGRTAANAVSLLCDGRWLRGRRPASFTSPTIQEPTAGDGAAAEDGDNSNDADDA